MAMETRIQAVRDRRFSPYAMKPAIATHRPAKATDGFPRKNPAEATRAPPAKRTRATRPRGRRFAAFASAMAAGSIAEKRSGEALRRDRGGEKGQRRQNEEQE